MSKERFLLSALIFCVLGCAGSSSEPLATQTSSQSNSSREAISPSAETLSDTAPSQGSQGNQTATAQQGQSPANNGQPRRVIHNTTLTLHVTEFGNIDDRVPELTEQHGGYITTAAITRNKGEARSGRWEIRIPVDSYRVFMSAICQLGEAIARNETAQDVTDEFVDLEARLRNEQAVEAGIVESLKQSGISAAQIQDLEKRLAAARGTIEALQGQFNLFDNKTSYAYVTLDATEELSFAPTAGLTESDRIGLAWTKATTNAKSLGTSVVVRLIESLPWAILLTPLMLLTWYFVRMAKRWKRAPSPQA